MFHGTWNYENVFVLQRWWVQKIIKDDLTKSSRVLTIMKIMKHDLTKYSMQPLPGFLVTKEGKQQYAATRGSVVEIVFHGTQKYKN